MYSTQNVTMVPLLYIISSFDDIMYSIGKQVKIKEMAQNMDKEPPVKHTIHEVIHNLQENKEIPKKMKKELDK